MPELSEHSSDILQLCQQVTELQTRLREEKAVRDKLETSNDQFSKSQIQLEQRNEKLRFTNQELTKEAAEKRSQWKTFQDKFQSLQRRCEEKDKQLQAVNAQLRQER